MKYVLIEDWVPVMQGESEKPEILCRVEWDEKTNEVRLVGCVPNLETELRRGIIGRQAKAFTMADGLAFLENLQWEFKNAPVTATRVLTDEETTRSGNG